MTRPIIGESRLALRVLADLTREQLAKKAGVSVATVKNAERGGHLSEQTIRALADACGVEPCRYLA